MSDTRACQKAAIDCTGYRCEMDHHVDLIINGIGGSDEAIDEFIKMQQKQQKEWLAFVKKHFGFGDDDD